jgi:dolichyl-phosphate-mannose--protein O-mannosyl transferase
MFDLLSGAVHVPVWLQVATMPTGTSTIVILGNPAVWWVGFAAVIALTVYLLGKLFAKHFSVKNNLPALFLVVVFFFQWLPYVLITRVIFIYHFYVDVPFLCLGTAFFVSRYWSNKWVKILAIAYFALTVAMFVLFYPVISGAPASSSTIASLHWFKSWVF